MAMLPLTAQTTERGLKECIRMGIDALSQFVLTEEPSPADREKAEHARSWQMAGYYGVMLIIAQLGNVLPACLSPMPCSCPSA